MSRIPRHRRALLLVIAVLLAAPSLAMSDERLGDIRPIRMEGFWDRNSSAPKVLESVRLVSTEGGPQRYFGITALQAYQPPEEGVQVLRNSSLQGTLRVLGREEMVRKLMTAPSTEKVTIYGVYRPASATLTLNSVEISGAGAGR